MMKIKTHCKFWVDSQICFQSETENILAIEHCSIDLWSTCKLKQIFAVIGYMSCSSNCVDFGTGQVDEMFTQIFLWIVLFQIVKPWMFLWNFIIVHLNCICVCLLPLNDFMHPKFQTARFVDEPNHWCITVFCISI